MRDPKQPHDLPMGRPPERLPEPSADPAPPAVSTRSAPPDIHHPTEISRHPTDIDLEPEAYVEHRKASFAERMFDIGWGGWLRLGALSVLAGVLIRAAGVNPFDRTFTWSGALQDLGAATVSLGGWVIANGWLPLLTGALVVAPLWLLWRLLSLPFRGPRDR